MSGRLAALALAVVLGGCAATPPASMPGTDTSVDTDARNRARIHTELAAGYLELGNLAVALEEANEALRSDTTYSPAYNISALVYAALREDQLAEQQFERALRLNPADADSHNNYGLFLCQRQREEQGIRHFLQAVRNPLYQTPERSYVNAGVCSRRRGDVAGAQEFFERALKLRPSQPQALFQLADLEFQRGNLNEARSHAVRLTQIAPNAEGLWLALRIERRLGDRNAEASYAAQLRRSFPDSTEARSLAAGRYE